jgi:hypothetical protein
MMEGADCSPQCRTVKGLAIASIGLSSVVVSSEISGGSDQGSDRAGSAARKLTDFCMTALTNAVRRKIAEHETIVLSDRDRAVFFDALVKVGIVQTAIRSHVRLQATGIGRRGAASSHQRIAKKSTTAVCTLCTRFLLRY